MEVDELVVVSRRPLVWEEDQLRLGVVLEEPFRVPPGLSLAPGDRVSLHWDFVCDRLDGGSLTRLESVHDKHLAIANLELSSARLEPAR